MREKRRQPALILRSSLLYIGLGSQVSGLE